MFINYGFVEDDGFIDIEGRSNMNYTLPIRGGGVYT